MEKRAPGHKLNQAMKHFNHLPFNSMSSCACVEFACRMEFLLSGRGTMPTVTLESPLDRDQSGVVIMNFGEVIPLLLGK